MPKHLAVIVGKVDGLVPVGKLTINLVNGLVQRGYRVTMLTGSVIDAQLDPGVTIKTPKTSCRLLAFDLYQMRRWLEQATNKIKPDVTIALQSFFRAQINVPAEGLMRYRANAAIADDATLLDRLVNHAICLLPSFVLGQRYERQMLHDESLKALVALSPLCEAQLDATEKKQGVTVYRASMPIPEQTISSADRKVMRDKLALAFGLSAESYWIAHPFQTAWLGGLEAMIRAFKPMIDEGLDAVMLVAGPYRYTHLAWIGELGLRDAVRFIGETARGDELIAACDLTVCPTSYDPAGWGVLPALGTDTPIVTTSACGLAQTVKQRGGTILKSPADPVALLEAIRTHHNAWLKGAKQPPTQANQTAQAQPLIEVIDLLVQQQGDGAVQNTDSPTG